MSNTYNNKGMVDADAYETNSMSQADMPSMDDNVNLNEFENEVENESSENISEGSEKLDIASLKQILCTQCTTMQEAEETRLRSLAEMDNFKKRMQREKEEQVKYAAEKVLQDIVPALDNLDLALQYANNDACKDIITGIQMTRKLLLDSLKIHGLTLISDIHVPFDPEIHEAMAQEASTEVPSQHIVKCLQNGYLLKDRLLRPAKVVVAI